MNMCIFVPILQSLIIISFRRVSENIHFCAKKYLLGLWIKFWQFFIRVPFYHAGITGLYRKGGDAY